MRPFNLEEAKAGKPVCTRDGRDGRIICFDRRANIYPIVALMDSVDKNSEILLVYTNKGFCYPDRITDNDLVMKPEKKEGWVNVYEHPDHESFVGTKIFENEESAKLAATDIDNYKTTAKIEWEE